MNKNIILFFLFCNYCFAQTLPKKDNGIALSYNYSNMHILNNPEIFDIKPIFFPSLEYKRHFNFKNNFSIKTGASLFVTGNRYKYQRSGNFHGPPSEKIIVEGESVSIYIRIPILASINFKNFYLDIGGAPCVTFVDAGQSYYTDDNRRFRFTYTLESHIGYYIPIKQKRLFIEFATYISEISHYIHLDYGNFYTTYKNKYSQNFQLSVGFMFNKNKELTKITQ